MNGVELDGVTVQVGGDSITMTLRKIHVVEYPMEWRRELRLIGQE